MMRSLVLFLLVTVASAAVGQAPMTEGQAGGPPAGDKKEGGENLPPPAPPVVEYRHVGEVSHVHRWHAGGGRRNGSGRRVRGGISIVSLKQFENVERTVLQQEFPKAYLHGEQLAVKDPTVTEGRARIVASGGLLYDAASAAGHKGLLPPMGKPLPFAFGAAAQAAPAPQPGAPGGAPPPAGGDTSQEPAPASGGWPTWLKAIAWIVGIGLILLIIGRLARGAAGGHPAHGHGHP